MESRRVGETTGEDDFLSPFAYDENPSELLALAMLELPVLEKPSLRSAAAARRRALGESRTSDFASVYPAERYPAPPRIVLKRCVPKQLAGSGCARHGCKP